MSTVHVSRNDQDDGFTVSLEAASIQISELRVRPMANWKTPHQLMGRGGSSLAMTDIEFMQLVSEYLRYTLTQSVDFEKSQVDFKHSLHLKRPE